MHNLKSYRFISYMLVFLLAFGAGLLLFKDARAAWDHTVIMNAEPGSSYSVPIPTPRACVYVTDCTEQIGSQPTPPQPTPPVVNSTPTPIGTYGWSFYQPIDRAGWIVTADAELEPAADAIDIDPLSIWRTGTSGAGSIDHPHHIIIDMGTRHWVDSMIYTPRPYDPSKSYSENGNIKDYEVWVSADNQTWGRVADGTLVYNSPGQAHTIKFLVPNLVQYVKLVSLSDVKDSRIAVAGDIQITESLKDAVITGGGVP